jgi:hypothetical protein
MRVISVAAGRHRGAERRECDLGYLRLVEPDVNPTTRDPEGRQGRGGRGERQEAAPPSQAEVQAHEIGNRTFVIADVEPLDVDGVRTMAVGSTLWLVAFLMLLPFYGWLEQNDTQWWLWTCLAGFGLGMFGWDHCRRRRRSRRAQAPPQLQN